MYLITSAAFVATELQSEFGPLPPSFLPVGNKRLFHHQLALIPRNERIILTLPEGFNPSQYDSDSLADRNVELLYLPTRLNLGESVVYALNLLELEHDEALFILHGDTLLDQLSSELDQLGISQVEDNYDWAEYNPHTARLSKFTPEKTLSSELISNGFFSFSAPKILIRHIIIQNWDFILGINAYIQDIGMAPHLYQHWYDFGHCHTYFQSKSRMTTQRAFNEMSISGQVVTKASYKKNKLAAEARWYQTIPGTLRSYTPQLLATNNTKDTFGYSIEYFHLTALNELYVFSQLPAFSWRKMLKACCQFLKQASEHRDTDKQSLDQLFAKKTQQRLFAYKSHTQLDINSPITVNGKQQPSLAELAEISLKYLPLDSGQINVLHGDFCFSNILYDFRTCNIKVIDPRGIDAADQPSIYGNTVYDIAKLSHSVIGLYDAIIAGYFDAALQQQDLTFSIMSTPRQERIITDFIHMIYDEFGITENQLYAMQIQLFISMLPLHSDRQDRQLGFIGNAYRLFDKIKLNSGST
ncbi:capsular biosynthesis protein [Shewanella gelidimarina]|uniref:capsular biosynthesis protein n=1 Tax=Shewanella gelidimarina TaxID=56813 RepID=UPI00200D641E|nr:capsular biosynthesis protein [Shewanella gelidimarina]MCL1056397.1 capsular biosynthesis protein [Shewanella gelidimarina]